MMLRSFIAIRIPTEIQSAISLSTAGLQEALPRPLVRWVPPQNVHLTLKFLGDVSSANLEQFAGALKKEVAKHATFTISVCEIGSFPNPRRARVIWIGLQAPVDLDTLQRAVDAVALQLGYPMEGRLFSPHLTIGRVGQNISTGDLLKIRVALDATHIGVLGTAVVDAIHIFKSDIQPTGSIYTQLYTLPLKS